MAAPKEIKEVNKGGRPNLYKEEYAEQAYKLCLLGATDKEIADFFDVCEATVNNWKIAHPQFLESLKKGKVGADANVANRLYNRALGYEHPEVELKVVSLPKGAGSVVEQVPITKIYPPDTTAAIFWLKNRQPDKWRDKPNSIDPNEPIQIEIIRSQKKSAEDTD